MRCLVHQSWEARVVSKANKDKRSTHLGALRREIGTSEPGTRLIRTHSRIDSVLNMYPGQRHETMQSVLWIGTGIREVHTSNRRAGTQPIRTAAGRAGLGRCRFGSVS